jgi:hypothetical protein
MPRSYLAEKFPATIRAFRWSTGSFTRFIALPRNVVR